MLRWVKRIVALIIVASLVGILVYRKIHKNREQAMYPLLASQKMVFDRVSSLVKAGMVLKFAANFPENVELAKCVFPGGECVATQPDRQIEFILPRSRDKDSGLMAGTSSNPARYNMQLDICETNCPWEVVTSFWAECPDQAPTCEAAESIHVRVLVRPAADYDWPVVPQSIPPMDDFVASTDRFAFEVAMSSER